MRTWVDLEEQIDTSINLAIYYLKSTCPEEEPVNYELNMGVNEPDIIRGIGHTVQAIVKTRPIDEFVEHQINSLINTQKPNGEFVGKSGIFESDRELTNNTDLTAFISRTLAMYYRL